MTTEELRELFIDMMKKGIRPMLCDTEIKRYDTYVPCGDPAMCPDDSVETVLFPKELLSMHPEFIIPVKGDSMKNVGIVSGDEVKVQSGVLPSDGEIVLASIDGDYTLKVYFEDEDGQKWLVPQNDDYSPILLEESKNARIVGIVREVMKKTPRVASRLCIKAINRAKMKRSKPVEITPQKVAQALRAIAPKIKIARQWFAVYRVLVDKGVIRDGDYDAFCNLVAGELPQHPHLPKPVEMNRLATDCFTKPVAKWREDNAPVKGKRFLDYLMIANEMKKSLEEC